MKSPIDAPIPARVGAPDELPGDDARTASTPPKSAVARGQAPPLSGRPIPPRPRKKGKKR